MTKTTTQTTHERDQQLEAVAKAVLDIPTLETRKHDSLDFHEVSAWGLREALRKAYMAGYGAAISDVDPERVQPKDGCPNCGEIEMDHLVWRDDATVHCTSCDTRYQPRQRR